MNDFVQLQEDVTSALLSAEALALINIAQYRKLRVQSEIDWSSIWTNPRVGGRSGCGVLVEMPTFEVLKPNLPGPEGQLVLSCAVLEEPNLNLVAETGTLLSAEEVCQRILDVLHGLEVEGIGGLYADGQAIQVAEDFSGLVAYRVRLRVRMLRSQTPRVATPNITEAALQVTLSCPTEGADIYYTEDGSFPGPSNGAAVKYNGAFTMTGTVLRWAAYKAGMVGSNVGQAANNSQ